LLNHSYYVATPLAYNMHKKSIAIFVHNDDRVEVARGLFMNKDSYIDMTQLESEMSLLHVKSSNKEKLQQIQSAICVN
jgi:hypothetical protein